MSGICAIWTKENPGCAADSIAAMTVRLAISKEERQTRAADGSVAVGISARFATQQLYEDSRMIVACDADLCNEKELERAIGHHQQSGSASNTAALLGGLYEKWGVDFIEKLRGAFSLIVWDKQQRTMLAATDNFGINPLVYYSNPNIVLVGSRIDALMQSGAIPAEVNPCAIANVLNFSSDLGPGTVIKNVSRLLPGTLLLASARETGTKKYWDMRYEPESRADEDRLAREMESVVERSVAACCKEDSFRELGAFLSGGTDSSTVVGMMSRTQRGPVKTFSIGFQEQPFNELGYAEITAKKFSADHHTYLVGPEDCLQAIPEMVRTFDEPFGNSSAIPTYFCARLAAQNGVKTLLAGDGGDELFGGNERYATDKIFQMYQSVPSLVRKGLIEPVLASLPMKNGIVGKARSYIRRSNLPNPQRLFSYHFLCANAASEIFQPEFLAGLGSYSVMDIPSRYYAQAPARDHLDRLLYADVKMTLGDNDLPKVTRMSELAGIQARFPFLDRPVAEFSGRIPAHLKVKGFEKRYLFKRAFRDLLPIEVIQKKKHGFGIPVATWLKSHRPTREFGRDVLLSSRASQRGYFRPEYIQELFRKHEADDTTYYGDALWTFLAVELWHREFIDQAPKVTA